MAKRRRKGDRKKLSKHERKLRSEEHGKKSTDAAEESRYVDRTELARARTRRNDMLVISIAIIFIAAVTGGYFVYENYLKPTESEENGGELTPGPTDLYKIPDFELLYPADSLVIMEITDYGSVVLELYRTKQVPITVENFLDYVNRGFYNGLIFHRVIDGFMIQGGGFHPDLNEKDLPPDKNMIPLEIDQSLKHVDGALAMARQNSPDTATCQFFIDDGPQPSLEPGGVDQYGYSVFGQVIGGMEHVREISGVDTHTEKAPNGMEFENVPVKDVIIRKMYEYFPEPQ
ncbi:peptidylprolyl isomerase [[Eubacterium] cellulosolvens]